MTATLSHLMARCVRVCVCLRLRMRMCVRFFFLREGLAYDNNHVTVDDQVCVC